MLLVSLLIYAPCFIINIYGIGPKIYIGVISKYFLYFCKIVTFLRGGDGELNAQD